MTVLLFLQQQPILYVIVSVLLGLCIGSFLNVVIYRLPKMLQHAWQQQCAELAGNTIVTHRTLNLAMPRSFCPHCQHTIAIWQNIPLLSYLLLRGKCAYCKHSISPRYFFIELLTGLMSGAIAFHFGVSVAALGALLFVWCLIPLIFIDLEHQLLPDEITLPLLWLGLLFNIFQAYAPLADAVFGAMAGYLSLWLLMHAYKLVTGKVGMGHGDFKLFAALGAWLGWQMLPFIIIVAALLGTLVGGSYLLLTRQKSHTPIPFGPFLAIAGGCALLFHTQLLGMYLG